MATLGELLIGLGIDTKGLDKGLRDAETGLNRFEKKTKKSSLEARKSFNTMGKVAGVAIVGMGVAMIKTAGQFEKSMQNISTLISGDATPAIKEMEKGIIELSKKLPKTPNELGASAYDIFSAGITDTADALNVLEQSAKLSIAGLGTQEQAVDLVTSAINAFGLEAKDSEEVANILFTTVKQGKTTVGEMAAQFGNMATAANAAGITFEDMQAQVAGLTSIGLKTAAAQTSLVQLFVESTKQGNKFTTTMGKSGITQAKFTKLIGEKGFVGALEAARDTMGLTNEGMKELFGSVEAQKAAFGLLTEAGDTYRDTLGQMDRGTQDFNDAVDKNSKGFEQSMVKMKSAWERLSITFGETGALDAASGTIESLADALDTVSPFLKQWGDDWKAQGTNVQLIIGDVLNVIDDMNVTLIRVFNETLSTLDAWGQEYVDFQTKVVNTIKGMWTAIKKSFTDGGNSVVQTLKNMVNDGLAELWRFAREAVGFSIIPDMWKDIDKVTEVGGKNMVDRIAKSVDDSNKKFQELSGPGEVAKQFGRGSFPGGLPTIETLGPSPGKKRRESPEEKAFRERKARIRAEKNLANQLTQIRGSQLEGLKSDLFRESELLAKQQADFDISSKLLFEAKKINAEQVVTWQAEIDAAHEARLDDIFIKDREREQRDLEDSANYWEQKLMGMQTFEEMATQTMDQLAQGMAEGLGKGLGQAIAGQKKLGKALEKTTAETLLNLADMWGTYLIAKGIGDIATGNAPMGTAEIAAGIGLKALTSFFASKGSGASSSGGGAGAGAPSSGFNGGTTPDIDPADPDAQPFGNQGEVEIVVNLGRLTGKKAFVDLDEFAREMASRFSQAARMGTNFDITPGSTF